MLQEWIEPYINKVGQGLRSPGNNSYTRNLSVALNYAFKDQVEDKKPVLFVLLHRNHYGLYSVMMSGEAYSSYPSEGEMLIVEGSMVKILGTEEDVQINNKHESLKEYFTKKVMVVYLYLDFA